jgi:hypothetical protein
MPAARAVRRRGAIRQYGADAKLPDLLKRRGLHLQPWEPLDSRRHRPDGDLTVALRSRSRRVALDRVEDSSRDAGFHPDGLEAVSQAVERGHVGSVMTVRANSASRFLTPCNGPRTSPVAAGLRNRCPSGALRANSGNPSSTTCRWRTTLRASLVLMVPASGVSSISQCPPSCLTSCFRSWASSPTLAPL